MADEQLFIIIDCESEPTTQFLSIDTIAYYENTVLFLRKYPLL